MNIYLVGNALISSDAMPSKIKPYLKKKFPDIFFIDFDPTENFPDDAPPIFIDTVININEPRLFSSLKDFENISPRNLSLHGFDFYTELALRHKLNKNPQWYIIGIPKEGNVEKIAQQVITLMKHIFNISIVPAKNGLHSPCTGHTHGKAF